MRDDLDPATGVAIIVGVSVAALIVLICIGVHSNRVHANDPVQVQLIVEKDGCKVYRVEGRDVYFTTCKGSVDWEEQVGKHSEHRQNITGVHND